MMTWCLCSAATLKMGSDNSFKARPEQSQAFLSPLKSRSKPCLRRLWNYSRFKGSGKGYQADRWTTRPLLIPTPRQTRSLCLSAQQSGWTESVPPAVLRMNGQCSLTFKNSRMGQQTIMGKVCGGGKALSASYVTDCHWKCLLCLFVRKL